MASSLLVTLTADNALISASQNVVFTCTLTDVSSVATQFTITSLNQNVTPGRSQNNGGRSIKTPFTVPAGGSNSFSYTEEFFTNGQPFATPNQIQFLCNLTVFDDANGVWVCANPITVTVIPNSPPNPTAFPQNGEIQFDSNLQSALFPVVLVVPQ